MISVRALISSKEAGALIGKGGAQIDTLRKEFQVKAGVSQGTPGVYQRILTLTGDVPTLSNAFREVIRILGEEEEVSIHLLMPHQLVGCIIGKQGQKIKDLQSSCATKVVISKEMLPHSNDRQVDVSGPAANVGNAIEKIVEAIASDFASAVHSTPYDPTFQPLAAAPKTRKEQEAKHDINIPADLVGCLIGKQGKYINYLRRASGAKILVNDRDAATSNGSAPSADVERIFTIQGDKECVDKALELIYKQVEKEKMRRLESKKAAGSTPAESPSGEQL